MSLPGSQGVSKPSFMTIGPKLWALEGYIHTDLLLLYRLAYRPAPRTFQLALWGYLVASLPRASRSHFARFACARFALTKIFEKKRCVSIDSKCSETRKSAKKIFFIPFDPLRASRSAKFTKIFEKNKCVSIDSKCSETRKNAKKKIFTPLTDYALRA